jgi:hypothetical protein
MPRHRYPITPGSVPIQQPGMKRNTPNRQPTQTGKKNELKKTLLYLGIFFVVIMIVVGIYFFVTRDKNTDTSPSISSDDSNNEDIDTETPSNQQDEPEEQDDEPSQVPNQEQEPEEVSQDFNEVTGLKDSELEKQALEKASINSQKAKDLCLSISSEGNRDYCLGEVAKKSDKDFFCQYIKDEIRKDGCYMDLALEGNPALCENIENDYNKKTCEALT